MEKSQIYLKQVKRGRNTKNNIGYYYIWIEKERKKHKETGKQRETESQSVNDTEREGRRETERKSEREGEKVR